jgi:hypothetical protein
MIFSILADGHFSDSRGAYFTPNHPFLQKKSKHPKTFPQNGDHSHLRRFQRILKRFLQQKNHAIID